MVETIACTDTRCAKGETGDVSAASPIDRNTKLVNEIYRTIDRPAHWQSVLATLAQSVNASTAALIVHDRRRDRGYIANAFRIPSTYCQNYASLVAPANPWFSAYEGGLDIGIARSGDEIIEFKDLSNSYLYRGFLEPLDIHHTIHVGIWEMDRKEVHLMLGRGRLKRPFVNSELFLVQETTPHLTRAWQVTESLTKANHLNLHILQVLDRLTIGVIVFDETRRVVAKNKAATEIIDGVDGLSMGSEGLETLLASHNRPATAISNASPGHLPKGMRFSAHRASNRGPVAIMTWPLPGRPTAVSNGLVALISDPYRQSGQFEVAMIMELFSITPAEARMASKMAHGNSLDRIAKELGISIHTARTHLKRIFEKIGVERQSELVHVLQNSFGFLRSTDSTDNS